MLHKINEGHVISDEGYSIKMGRNHLSYIEENGYSVSFDVENMINPFCMVIYLEGIDHFWHPPHQLEKLNDNDIKKIQLRINNIMRFLNITYEIA